MALTVEQFAEKIKIKHPEYADVDNTELVDRMVKKFPVYEAQITRGAPEITRPGQIAVGAAKETFQEAKTGLGKVKEGAVEQVKEMVGKDAKPEVSGEGFRQMIEGGIQTLFSPVTGILKEGLEVTELEEPVSELTGRAMERVNEAIDEFASKRGVDVESDTYKEAKRQAGLAFEVATVAGAPKGIKQTKAAATKAKKGAKEGLEASAIADVEKVLAPTKVKTKQMTKGLLRDPEAIKRLPFAATRESLLTKLKSELKVVGDKFDEFETQGGVQGATDTALLDDFLESKKADFMVQDVVIEPKAIRAIEGIQDIVREFGPTIPNTRLRDIRRIWDRTVAKSNGFIKTLDEGTELGIKKDLTGVMREELAKANPDLAKINKEFKFYKDLETVLEETVKRKTGQTGALTKGVARAAGAAAGTGFLPSLFGAVVVEKLTSALGSSAWKLASAKLKKRLADSLVAADKAEITSILDDFLKSAGVEAVIPEQNQE